MIGGKNRQTIVARAHFVGVFLPRQLSGPKTGANLDALDRIDAHQRAGDFAVQLAVDRRAPAGRRPFGDNLDHRADRGAGFADFVEISLESLRRAWIRAKERIAGHFAPIPTRALYPVLAHLHERAANGHSGHDTARDRAGGDPRRRLARGGTAAAAIIADPVFRLVGEIGMARPVFVLDLAIVFRTLIDILDE